MIDYAYDVKMNNITALIKASDIAGVKTLKYLPGSQSLQAVKAGADITAAKCFPAQQDAIYTVYAEDYFGNENVIGFRVNAPLDKAGPDISYSLSGKTDKIVVRIAASDPSDVAVLKYMAGKRTLSVMQKKGAGILGKNSFTVKKNGVYTILAADALGNMSIKVINVKFTAVKSLGFTKRTVTLAKGKTYAAKLKVSPSNATNKAVKYKSSNKKIATVDANGVIKAVKKGRVTITATAADGSGKKAAIKVVVK